MAIAHTKQVIAQFLAEVGGFVLVLRGGWGVGKTHLWRTLVKEAKHQKRLKPELYAYVSLFGIDTVEQLKEAIVLSNIDPSSGAKLGPLSERWQNLKTVFRSNSLPALTKYFSAGLLFPFVKDTLICLDDLERRGKNLEVQQVLGLASLLREERNCKVALIFNDLGLSEGQNADFRLAGEKLIDTEIDLTPSTEEIIGYVFSKAEPYLSDFIQSCQLLKINNIRTLQRIERLWRQLEASLKGVEEAVIKQAVHSLVLLTWAHYEKGATVPSLKYIMDLGLFASLKKDKTDKTDTERIWDRVLNEYRFSFADSLDQEIAAFVQRGYYDHDILASIARVASEEALHRRKRSQHLAVWESFHNSFDQNDEEFVTALESDIRENIAYLSLGDIESAVRVLRKLNHSELADELVDLFFQNNSDKQFNLGTFPISDPYILNNVNERNYLLNPKLNLSEVIERIARTNSWHLEDEEFLEACAVDDYYSYFKNDNSDNLTEHVKTCLQFGQYSTPSGRQKTIDGKATAALIRIAAESPLNELRVSIIYGITDKGVSD
jgi:hypothetical protein